MQEPEIGAIIAIYAGVIGCVLLFSFLIWGVIGYLLSSAAQALPETYRSVVSPGQAYFLLIPLFNIYWIFVYPKSLSSAYQDYFRTVNVQDKGDCGEQHGQWWAICTIASILPCIGMVAGIASLVFMILYIIQILECKKVAEISGTAGSFSTGSLGPDESNPYQP